MKGQPEYTELNKPFPTQTIGKKLLVDLVAVRMHWAGRREFYCRPEDLRMECFWADESDLKDVPK